MAFVRTKVGLHCVLCAVFGVLILGLAAYHGDTEERDKLPAGYWRIEIVSSTLMILLTSCTSTMVFCMLLITSFGIDEHLVTKTPFFLLFCVVTGLFYACSGIAELVLFTPTMATYEHVEAREYRLAAGALALPAAAFHFSFFHFARIQE